MRTAWRQPVHPVCMYMHGRRDFTQPFRLRSSGDDSFQGHRDGAPSGFEVQGHARTSIDINGPEA